VRRLLILLVVLLAVPAAPARASTRGACVVHRPGPVCHVWTGKLRSVDDGDTIDVDVDGDGTRAARRIRFTGVQAMEQTVYSARGRRGDCHAVEATLLVDRLIRRSHGRVRLAAEDPYSTAQHRLVRTVAVRRGGRWRDLGEILMRNGLALWWPGWSEAAPNARYSALLQQAIAAKRGLFDPDACGRGPAARLSLWVNWDGDGWEDDDPAGEWVTIRNLDPVNRVSLGGWYLRDAGLRRYTFPAHAAIPPGGRVTLTVGWDGNNSTVFAWGQPKPVFSDPSYDARAGGDGAYLFDPRGNVRAATVFPCRFRCSDPLQGAVDISAFPSGRDESVALTNVSGAPVDLDGSMLRSTPGSYVFAPGTVVPAGETLWLYSTGDPTSDSALEKGWGREHAFLRDAGGAVRLVDYSDITVACTAWGDRTCSRPSSSASQRAAMRSGS
jgi:endonuclease YncB( thermonuclease family)